jgi:hypothetical protein
VVFPSTLEGLQSLTSQYHRQHLPGACGSIDVRLSLITAAVFLGLQAPEATNTLCAWIPPSPLSGKVSTKMLNGSTIQSKVK